MQVRRLFARARSRSRQQTIVAGTRIKKEEFMPIYAAMKKEDAPIGHDAIVSCLANFEREQEGYILEVRVVQTVQSRLCDRVRAHVAECGRFVCKQKSSFVRYRRQAAKK